jgi:hypothetical protein
MSYQQPPAGMPPQAPMAPQAPMVPQAPMGMPLQAPVPYARKSTAALVGSILALVGVVLLLVATLGHTWLRPEGVPDDVSGGSGLWSTVMEGRGMKVDEPLSNMVNSDAGAAEDQARAGMFAYGSMAFFVVNWLVIVVLFFGTIMGFVRWAGAKPAGVPFALTLIPTIVAVVAFLAWFGVSVLLSEALDGMDLGGMVFLWWAGAICALVAAILFAKVRSARAFGAGFQGSGAMMAPGTGTIGQAMIPPGQGVIQNPADSIGRPQS